MDLRPTLLLVLVVAALSGCCFLLKICHSPQAPTRRKTFVPQPMMDLFHVNQRQGASPAATVVRGVLPSAHVWVPGSGKMPPRHLLDFRLPPVEVGETLMSAQLKLRARPSGPLEGSVRAWMGAAPLVSQRRTFRLPRATWLTLNVTSALPRLPQLPLSVAVSAHGALQVVSGLEPPLLLLEYAEESPPARRPRRDAADAEDYEEETNQVWSKPTRTRTPRSACRRRPLYVDFAEIQYDRWIVAPSGYEAFQCSGKCSWPVSDHLTPTKHAIVQALVHSVSPGRAVRACCVPTSLEPISVLYVDHRGVVTYRYGYRDMVVAQCGCR